MSRTKPWMIVMLVVLGTMVAASASQLTDLGVTSKGGTTTLTLRTSGAFTHTEYRPTDNLLLVDLTGVAAGKVQSRSRDLRGLHPGVESYRIVEYKGASGTDTTRIEINLASGSTVGVDEANNMLMVHITAPASEAVAAPAAKPEKVAVRTETAPAAVRPGAPVQIRNVAVSRGKQGLQVEIAASGAIEPKVMTLTAPDRIVLDIANAVPMTRREIAVNTGEVKGIRVSRFSAQPPVTRIVVDLKSAQQYEMAAKGSSVTLALSAPMAAKTVAVPETAPVETASAVPALTAQDAVVVEPKVTTRPASQAEIDNFYKDPSPSERAAAAASKFSGPGYDLPATNASASIRPEPALNLAALPQAAAQNTATGGCATGRYSGEPISVNLKDVDVRDFFRLIHEISGLNVVLDPAVKGSLTIVLDDVPWDQALAIVMRNNGLDCQLDGNVLRIATTATLKKEADDRRAQTEAQALAVDVITLQRYLSYAAAKDVVPTIKAFLSQRGTVIADERTNALIISDIPSVLPNVDRLIGDLVRKTQEVEIEARVVAANRSFSRDIGTQLGFGWKNASTQVSGSQGGISPLVGGLGDNIGPVPFFSNLAAGPTVTAGIGLATSGTNYRLDFLLSMAEARGLIKILSRPRVVTQNNNQAVIRQGARIPVVTQAQLGGPPTVQYFEAFLRLTVRPQITAEGTIFLNVDVENTIPDFSRVSNANPNPLLLTQQATTQVLVTDGGTVVIGGVIQTNNNVAITQVPLLGSIPVFGNLFKRRSVSSSTQELIFFLTPKIIQT